MSYELGYSLVSCSSTVYNAHSVLDLTVHLPIWKVVDLTHYYALLTCQMNNAICGKGDMKQNLKDFWHIAGTYLSDTNISPIFQAVKC